MTDTTTTKEQQGSGKQQSGFKQGLFVKQRFK